jgi:hypothetical protein
MGTAASIVLSYLLVGVCLVYTVRAHYEHVDGLLQRAQVLWPEHVGPVEGRPGYDFNVLAWPIILGLLCFLVWVVIREERRRREL